MFRFVLQIFEDVNTLAEENLLTHYDHAVTHRAIFSRQANNIQQENDCQTCDNIIQQENDCQTAQVM